MNVMNYGKCGDLSVKWEYSKSTHKKHTPNPLKQPPSTQSYTSIYNPLLCFISTKTKMIETRIRHRFQ